MMMIIIRSMLIMMVVRHSLKMGLVRECVGVSEGLGENVERIKILKLLFLFFWQFWHITYRLKS